MAGATDSGRSNDELVIGDGRPGAVTMDLRRRLLDVQYGRTEDPRGWVVRVPRND